MAVSISRWQTSGSHRYFYRNEARNPGMFLGLHLLLPLHYGESLQTGVFRGQPSPGIAGRYAIGASATIKLPDGRRLVAQVDGGNGHSGKRSPGLHFGLGQISPDALLQVDLRWRDAQGKVHSETLSLRPGWHTVMFGQQTGRGDS